jgi:hypothetical protein
VFTTQLAETTEVLQICIKRSDVSEASCMKTHSLSRSFLCVLGQLGASECFSESQIATGLRIDGKPERTEVKWLNKHQAEGRYAAQQ